MFKRQLKSVEFKLLSNEKNSEIQKYRKISNVACDIFDNTLYDPKTGTIEKRKLCATCFLDFTKCKGHFGCIIVEVLIVNPIIKKQFEWVTQQYSRVIITKTHLKLNDTKCYKPSSKYIEKVS